MSKRKKHTPHEEEAGEAWLLPYSDLMTLLLAVFIVLFAVSQVDVKKAQEMSGEFSDVMMTEGYYNSTVKNQGAKNPGGKSEQEQMKEMKSQLDKQLQSEQLSSSVTTSIDKRGLVISLSNAMFFDPGSAEIKSENEKTLLELADKFDSVNNFIRIEGHTDSVPMSTGLYPSNWDLSTARASNVVRLLVNKGHLPPERLIAVGYGEYRPIADNDTEQGRAKNRRIDIIVLSQKFNDLEKNENNAKPQKDEKEDKAHQKD